MHPEASGRDAADALIDAAAAAMAIDSGGLLRAVLTAAPAGIALLDPQLHWRYVNPAFARATGLRPGDLLGREAAATPPAEASATLRAVLADGRPRVLHPAWPATGGDPAGVRLGAGIRLEAGRLELAGRVAGLVVVAAGPTDADLLPELERARHRLALLDEAADRIGTTLDTDTTCAELAEFTVPRLAELTIVDVLPSETAGHGGGRARGLPRLRRTAVACTPELRPRIGAFARAGESVRHRAGSATARSLETGRPVLTDLRSGEQPGGPAEDAKSLAAYRAAGLEAVLTVPLAARGQLIGAMTLARGHGSGPGFTEEDVLLIGNLAARAAIGIDNARRYTRSQGIALELQRALLAEPGNPHPNLELASRYLPSGTSSVVGGDWYESVRLPFGRTLLVMGDVMGHGVEAAVDMSNYRSMLRYVAGMDLPPHRILRQLDALICENEAARPATCLLALADPARHRWTFSSAGHLPPVLITADRANELVEIPTGPPLGTGFGGHEQAIHELNPEQVLLLYTDGLVERRGEDIDVSLARLAGLRLPAAGDLDDLLDSVLHGLTPHAAEDDIALLAARIRRR
ncbi:SpoIIE family protein phosphatase [Kitasatospora sp. NPDC050543]|uniref:SpoIIE family protein phosphatase n=1 Tax=Kitasatospora sp. NPDC050543 TaxID=3364054 RepID=UPI0037A40559